MAPRQISSLSQILSRGMSDPNDFPNAPRPRFLASRAHGPGFDALTRDRIIARRITPPNTFERCERPSASRGWRESLGMFRDWILGRGPDTRVFGPCSQQTQDMDNALGVEGARDHLYEKNAGRPYEEWEAVKNYVGAFGLRGILRAGRDPTEQFIGRYKVEIFPQPDKTLRFEVTNTTSMESFLYGLGPEYEREDFLYGGNMKQLITWTEPAIIPE